MRWKSAVGVAVMLGCASPALAQESAGQSLDEIAPQIDALFARYQADQHIPGLVYGIVQDGKLVYLKGRGVQDVTTGTPVDGDTLFRIASMTKAFTALAVLNLRDRGKLRLDDLAEDYVPEMKRWTYPTADSPRIRGRDLLHHVAGFVTDDPWGDRQQTLSQDDFTKMLAAGVPFTQAPQSRFEYSNFGYALLGRIVANASGMPYADYVRITILRPLGMEASGYDVTRAPRAHYARGYRWEARTRNGRRCVQQHGRAAGQCKGLCQMGRLSAVGLAAARRGRRGADPARDGARDRAGPELCLAGDARRRER